MFAARHIAIQRILVKRGLDGGQPRTAPEEKRQVRAVAFSRDGQRIANAGHGIIRIWKIEAVAATDDPKPPPPRR